MNELLYVKLVYVNKKTDHGGSELLNCRLKTSKLLWLPPLHVATDDVTTLLCLHQWFPVTLGIPSKCSPKPHLPPITSPTLSLATVVACHFWNTPGTFLLQGFYICCPLCVAYSFPPQTHIVISFTLDRSQLKYPHSRGSRNLHRLGKEHPYHILSFMVPWCLFRT